MTKRYGVTVALDDVHFVCRPGEIHALLGENGAGKSTLIKVLTGVVTPDGGSVEVLGTSVDHGHDAPSRMIRRGLSTVYQDLSLVPGLTVARNLELDRRWGFRPARVAEAAAAAALEEYSLTDVSPSDLVEELTLGQRQKLDIVRAVARSPRVLLLDEATSALSGPDVSWLFQLLTGLREQGVSVVMISHRMGEIRESCDRITVLRNGRSVDTVDAATVSDDDIVRMMLGRSLAAAFPERPPTHTDQRSPMLTAHSLTVGTDLVEVDLTIGAGEVVGVAGLEGQGQLQLFMALYGMEDAAIGSIEVQGRPQQFTSPRDAIRAGIAYVPGERDRDGLSRNLSIAHNMSLPILDRLRGRLLIDSDRERAEVRQKIEELEVKASSPEAPIRSLSGGNAQKVLLGKWLLTDAVVYLLYDPTQGVDVGTKYEIAQLVLDLSARGRGVLFYSTDIDELVNLTDRVIVFYGGRVVAQARPPHLDKEEILAAMTGHRETDALAPDDGPAETGGGRT